MKQIHLLELYIKALQNQNEAKNKQRSILYDKIDGLTKQNVQLHEQIKDLKNIPKNISEMQQKQQIINSLNKNIQYLEKELEKVVNTLKEKDAEIENFAYQQEKDSQRIMNLQKIVKESKKQQSKLKQEINELDQQNRMINEQLQQYTELENQNYNDEKKINQLIENYEKIQQIAQEKGQENQYLHQQNQTLAQEIEQLKQIVQVKDNELKIARRSLKNTESSNDQYQNDYGMSFSGLRPRVIHKAERESGLTNMDLVRQNNKLIERITELERQKNLLYISTLDKGFRGNRNFSLQHYETPSVSPLRNITSRSNISQNNSASKLKLRIEALKHENEELMYNLKI